ncbi:tannase/feruloyl esterase family alpha/beta hydrolase [Piscinibacter sp. HJYY11]|uniref:tannase/feruloyl esterase family alpha/beta hydrolase n=1 Tax=Piscinibacter sp. HJYY11 TaxID=2801333 RepID=UPI00191E2B8D|nr:tannase/feruloyl esterase family alpha/beta hydrolase [Piscinibacter sp. HJYY11]MBL0728319.1 tannase/feruloyl esterase family alpha/beta hydrolase [Piscinibacter sp. HJYY11]
MNSFDSRPPRRRRRHGLGFLVAPLAGLGLLAACGGGDSAPPAAAAPLACDATALASVGLRDAALLSATPLPAGSYTPPGAGPQANLPAFCRMTARATPTADSLIHFEVWVPSGTAWNGKMVVTGNGGYSPSLNYGDMAYAMRQGYAVVGGDTGHQGDPNAMYWGVSHPEKIVDWGTRSIHAITGPARSLVGALAARDPSRAYYYGCSTGGHQAYAQIQRYPADFDGVIAGAPGNNRTRLNVEFLHRFLSNRATGTNSPVILTPAKATLITQRAVAACDALDGVSDGVINDPRACDATRFDVGALQCAGADDASCLTAEQVEVARRIYEGPRNRRTGAQIYPGLPVGSEAGWPGYWGGSEPVRADYWRLWVFENPQWNWWTFDYDRDLAFADAKISPLVDQTNADIAAFKARGAKAIVYQGWQDPVVNALDTIAYYDRVRTLQGSQAETDAFFRLFMVPGMGHCSGGSGATHFGNQGGPSPTPSADHDVLMALDRWVETGAAPDRLIASRVVGGATVRTRPLCPHPQVATYSGTGSTDDAASFTCQ